MFHRSAYTRQITSDRKCAHADQIALGDNERGDGTRFDQSAYGPWESPGTFSPRTGARIRLVVRCAVTPKSPSPSPYRRPGTERAVILVIMQEARNFSLHVIRLLEVGEGCRAFEELALDFGRESTPSHDDGRP
jgi:hypothetical protein